jgi:hypothetical protein
VNLESSPTVTRTSRLVAGTLVLALPLAAAAACGAEKKKTVRQEWSSAQSSLLDSKAASFTLKLSDAQGNLAKQLTKDGDVPPAIATALLKGSVTVVTDPAGDATLGSAQKAAGSGACFDTANLSKSNSAFVVRDDKADLLELRAVAGDLYAHVNLQEIGALAKAGGVDDFDAQLDEFAADADPRLAKAVTDVRAGKWLKLPLSQYLDQLKDLAGSVVPQATSGPCDFSAVGPKLVSAVKPYVKVTDANDSSKDRVLDVTVQVKPAVTALIGVLKADKSLPFAGLLGDMPTSEITDEIKDGVAKGTITLHDSHLTGFSVDLESLRQLSPDPGVDSWAGVQVAVAVDDSADALTAPTELSSVDLGAMIDEFLGSFMDQMSQGSSMSSGFSG